MPVAVFMRELRDACKLGEFEVITVKWMDDEGMNV
jgi:hypothetical protein